MQTTSGTTRLMLNAAPFRLDDQSWLALLEQSCADKSLGLPGFPSDDLQTSWIGSADAASIREVFPFYQLIKRQANFDDGPILDFGSGYGRITRFFLNDVRPEQLYGVDTDTKILEECRLGGTPGNFFSIQPLGTLPFADKFFSVVYAYSVFTHLPEPVQDRWLAEIHRVLKPRGLFVATVEPPRILDYFLSLDSTKDGLHPWAKMMAEKTQGDPSIKATLDTKGFAYVNGSEVYGDAFMTPGYVRHHWGKWFEIAEHLDDATLLTQAVVTARARA